MSAKAVDPLPELVGIIHGGVDGESEGRIVGVLGFLDLHLNTTTSERLVPLVGASPWASRRIAEAKPGLSLSSIHHRIQS